MEEDEPSMERRSNSALPLLLPFQRSFPLDSSFFDDGNEERERLAKLASLPPSSSFLSSPSPQSLPPPPPVFFCNVPHCTSSFTSLAAFDLHYHVTHSHTCALCSRRFPSAHLLLVHQHERHDPFFIARRQNGERVYACLVEECGWKGKGRTGRRTHMVKEHGWPPSFVFDERTQRKKRPAQRGRTTGEDEGQDAMRDLAIAPAGCASPVILRSCTSGSSPSIRPRPTSSAAAAVALPLSTASAPLRFAPRQVQRLQQSSLPPSHHPQVSPDPLVLPVLATLDYREAGVEADDFDDEASGKREGAMEVERKEAVAEVEAGDDEMDETMSSALSALRTFSMSSRQVPRSVTFGRRNVVRHAG